MNEFPEWENEERTKVDDGNEAFPHAGFESQSAGGPIRGRSGMSLRDFFAAVAMHAKAGKDYEMTGEKYAEEAYEIADAMIRVRAVSVPG